MTSTLDWMAKRITEIEQAAIEKERQRIIKLLDAQCQCPVPDRYHPSPCTCQEFIALIKGENK